MIHAYIMFNELLFCFHYRATGDGPRRHSREKTIFILNLFMGIFCPLATQLRIPSAFSRFPLLHVAVFLAFFVFNG
jgi:hypothetical protein